MQEIITIPKIIETISSIPFEPSLSWRGDVKINPQRTLLQKEAGIATGPSCQHIGLGIVANKEPLRFDTPTGKNLKRSNINFCRIVWQVWEIETDNEISQRGITIETWINEVKDGNHIGYNNKIFPLLSKIDQFGDTFYSYEQRDSIIRELFTLISDISDTVLIANIAEAIRFIYEMKDTEYIVFWGD
jgi:hypothetical protein